MTATDPGAAHELARDDVDQHAGEIVGPVALWALAAWVGARIAAAVLDGEHGPVVLGWLVGIPQSWRWSVAIALLVTICILAGYAMRPDRQTGALSTVTTTIIVAITVILVVTIRTLAGSQGPVTELADHGGTARAEVTVIREPRPIANGWHVVVRVEYLAGVPARQRAAITIDDDPPTLGTRWAGMVTARPVPPTGYGQWLRTQHVVAVLDVREWWPVGRAGVLAHSTEQVRDRIRQAATLRTDERAGGLLVGLVMGDTRLLPAADAEAMQATSLTHLTAVSGSHVAIVAGGVLGLAVWAGLGLRWRFIVVAAVIVWFAFLTRFEPSVVRAGAMALVLVAVKLRGVPGDSRHALATAVLIILLVDPRLAGSLGLMLSASATFGVLVFAPKVERRLARWPPRLAKVASMTIGAQIAVLPIVLATFGTMGLSAVPANIVAVPAAMTAAAMSFLGSVVALGSVDLAAVVFWVASWPVRIVLWSAHAFSDIGGSASWDHPVTVVATAAAGLWFLQRPQTSGARYSAVAVAFAAAMATVPIISGMLPPRDFTVTVIDVGQGDAFLVESPGARILIDAGGDSTAAQWLQSHGRRRIDVLIVTHPHLDHVGGAVDVVRAVDVGQVWYRPQPTALPQVSDLIDTAQRRGVAVSVPLVGAVTRVGDVVVEVLHPPEDRPFRYERSELNETSTVVRITAEDGRRVLATGDIEAAAQRMLLAERSDRLAAELITVPHHGAATSEFEFLAATRAQAGVIGVGHDNPHGHPRPEVLAMLAELDMQIVRSDLDGTTTVPVPARRDEPVGHTQLPATARGALVRSRQRRRSKRSSPRGYSHRYGSCGAAGRRRRPAVAAGARAVDRPGSRG